MPRVNGVETRVRALLGDDAVDNASVRLADRDPAEAVGLPAAAYQSQEWLDLEHERLFRRTWVFVAAEAQLAQAGSMLPVEVGGAPILLVRDADGQVQGFHNVCRHRGAALVDEPCVHSTITCPYHRWTYRLDGSLALRPHFLGPDQHDRPAGDGGPGLDLIPVRTETWNGCVFVNVSGDAIPLDQWLAPIVGRLADYPLDQMRWIDCVSFEINSNWKFAIENYMEGYHVFAIHPRLLDHAPMNTRWSGEWIGELFHNGYVAPALTVGRGDTGLPHWPGLDDEGLRTGLWTVTFPQFATEIFADHLVVFSIIPVAPDKTREELHIFAVGDQAATAPQYADARRELSEMWHDLNSEDIDVLERLQRGRRSPAYDGGRYSPWWEGPTHDFAGMVVEAVLADRLHEGASS